MNRHASPHAGKDVTLIMEHDISAAKRSEWYPETLTINAFKPSER